MTLMMLAKRISRSLIEAADAYIQQPKIQATLQEFLRISQ
ncbi:hypothetical protein NIES4075_04890 [Tolypothrix sp. NIES-4075]|nr:hypothetical protein NIES4075_04890 [Tolypothrix sp. NIES-4075]